MGADRFHPCNHLPQRSWGSCPAVQGSACGVVTAPGEGSRVATARENARRRAEKGVSGRAAKEGLRSAGPSEGAWHRKAAMRSERCAAASGLHLVAACDAHNRQLVSRRRILKYSIYTMIQALEVRATAGRSAAAGLRPETPGVSDFAKYRAPRTHRERHARAHERASKTVQPTLLPPQSGIYALGKERAHPASPNAGRRPSSGR
jgi:hypothetical protein